MAGSCGEGTIKIALVIRISAVESQNPQRRYRSRPTIADKLRVIEITTGTSRVNHACGARLISIPKVTRRARTIFSIASMPKPIIRHFRLFICSNDPHKQTDLAKPEMLAAIFSLNSALLAEPQIEGQCVFSSAIMRVDEDKIKSETSSVTIK